jgi:hypothetical protein
MVETVQFVISGNDHWGNSKQIMSDARKQYEVKEMLGGMTYDAAGLDVFRAKYPGIVSIGQVVLAYLAKGVPSYDMRSYVREEYEDAVREKESGGQPSSELFRPYKQTVTLYEGWNHVLKTASLIFNVPFEEQIMTWTAPASLVTPYEEEVYQPDDADYDGRMHGYDRDECCDAPMMEAPEWADDCCVRVDSGYYSDCAEVQLECCAVETEYAAPAPYGATSDDSVAMV